ncbi:MAG: translocation/assembly module TamB [Bacteroides sp.]|nr:translocation/assembly module TamB [Bacteroides sp.]
MKRKWVKRIGLVLLIPVFLFILVLLLLYVPSVQNYLRKEVTFYASQATGMEVNIGRIDLRFPLKLKISEVELIQTPDTVLSLESLSIHVKPLPLLKGFVNIEGLTLTEGYVNTLDLIDGMRLTGTIGEVYLESRGVDLSQEIVVVNQAEIKNSSMTLELGESEEKEDTTAAVNWKIYVNEFQLEKLAFRMTVPGDTLELTAWVEDLRTENVEIDLSQDIYSMHSLSFTGGTLAYDMLTRPAVGGLDPNHLYLRNIRIGIDSVRYAGHEIAAAIHELSMDERSGLSMVRGTAHLQADSTGINVPDLLLQTSHSEVSGQLHTLWETVEDPLSGNFLAQLTARLGKQDIMLFAGSLPEEFRTAYPSHPLTVRLDAQGNLRQARLSRISAELPGAFTLTGNSDLTNLTDSVNRTGKIDLDFTSGNLHFLSYLFSPEDPEAIVIPQGLHLTIDGDIQGPQYKANVLMNEARGQVSLVGSFNDSNDSYSADLRVTNLQLEHFLPKDSIYSVSATASIRGRGIDFDSYRIGAVAKAELEELYYKDIRITGISADAQLRGTLLNATVVGDNSWLQMNATGEYRLGRPDIEGKVSMEVTRLDLYVFDMLPEPLRRNIAFSAQAEALSDKVTASVRGGDLTFNLTARSDVEELIGRSTDFTEVLTQQIGHRQLDHVALRQSMPTVAFSLNAGQQNVLAYYLASQGVSYKDLSVVFGTAPRMGLNGRAVVHQLKVDTLQLDTVSLVARQDTSRLNLRLSVANGPDNPQYVFRATATGEIRDTDADLLLEFDNDKGEKGLYLGVNAAPMENGVRFKFFPDDPIVAFRQFYFNENNRMFLRSNGHLLADVEMLDKDGMGLRLHSIPDTVSLQNLDLELRRIDVGDVSRIFPYLPEVEGLLSADIHYIQTTADMQLSAEATIDEMYYEKQRVGDVTLGLSWLPGEDDRHYLNGYLGYEGDEVLHADGRYAPDAINVNLLMEHFPLHIVSVFVPDQIIALEGDIDGELDVSGATDKFLINGELALDSVSLYARQAGARFYFDNRPVQIENSQIRFDQFSIYTVNRNPFTLDGTVDISTPQNPVTNLNLQARNFTLLDASRTRESLIYGKVVMDLTGTLRGPVDALNLRGSVNILGNTDVTYVLLDSPLTVQDRLGDLVTFVSFTDTTTLEREEAPAVSLGGLDMNVIVQIDEGARLKADLTPDRSSRVELEGGGSLTLRYTPQGDLTLSGRYTLTGGMFKYTVPVIPLKEFTINDGSYVEWSGDPMDPNINFKATERVCATVSDDGSSSRMVNFDVSIEIKNRLENLELVFDVSAPEDFSVQEQLASMGAEERSKQAVGLLATGLYLAGTGSTLNMGSALNSVIQSQINAIAGSAFRSSDFSIGVEDYGSGSSRTDYSFRYSKRLFNDRVQVVIGGRVSTGADADNDMDSFIDNVSLEYRLDKSGTRFVRLFHNKNYESVLEGEITETGVGLVLRKKLSRLRELFVFRIRRRPATQQQSSVPRTESPPPDQTNDQ